MAGGAESICPICFSTEMQWHDGNLLCAVCGSQSQASSAATLDVINWRQCCVHMTLAAVAIGCTLTPLQSCTGLEAADTAKASTSHDYPNA